MKPPAHAWLGTGSVRHARLRPLAHRFAYPAFFLRLPLRTLSAQPWPYRLLARNRRAALVAFNDADHGDGRPPTEWIDDILRREGITDATGEIWLHTLPRVLGYVFNPVSFWLCERTDGRLRAVVCEVNNTFGERHFYLLAHANGRPIENGEELAAPKVFHVSPFCRIEGRYRFRFLTVRAVAASPLPERRLVTRFIARIDHDDRAGALLETSIEGRLAPLTDSRLARLLLVFPLFTFGVIARIHWQALKLWLKRVPFVTKPCPPLASVTRSGEQASSTSPT